MATATVDDLLHELHEALGTCRGAADGGSLDAKRRLPALQHLVVRCALRCDPPRLRSVPDAETWLTERVRAWVGGAAVLPPDQEAVRNAVAAGWRTTAEVRGATGLSQVRAGAALHGLEAAGILRVADVPGLRHGSAWELAFPAAPAAPVETREQPAVAPARELTMHEVSEAPATGLLEYLDAGGTVEALAAELAVSLDAAHHLVTVERELRATAELRARAAARVGVLRRRQVAAGRLPEVLRAVLERTGMGDAGTCITCAVAEAATGEEPRSVAEAVAWLRELASEETPALPAPVEPELVVVERPAEEVSPLADMVSPEGYDGPPDNEANLLAPAAPEVPPDPTPAGEQTPGERVYAALPGTKAELAERTGLTPRQVHGALMGLQRGGRVYVMGEMWKRVPAHAQPTALSANGQ